MKVPLTVTVAQTAGDLAHGTVMVQGTGEPRIDGQPLPATFTRRRFMASREVSNLPAMCIDQHQIGVTLDLEGVAPGRLTFTEVRSLACPPGDTYCKGFLGLDLTLQK